MEKKVVELFAGVGGFRVGLNDIKELDINGKAIEQRDWNFVWANQWEPSTKVQHAYNCYCKRFGYNDMHSNQDISSVDKNEIPDHSLLVGGFPCQDYSVARSLSGEKGIEGKKGVLFWEIADIMRKKKTPFILLENVDRLLKSPARQRGRDFGIMLRTFNDLGYNVEWRVINAADYGCAQKRRRLFIFAWKKDSKYNKNLTLEKNDLIHNGFFAKCFPIEKLENINSDIFSLMQYADTIDMTNNFTGRFENSGCSINGVVITEKIFPIIERAKTMRDIRQEDLDLSDYFLNDDQDIKFTIAKDKKRIPRKKPNGDDYFYSEGSMLYPDSLELPGRTILTSEASINRSTHIIEDAYTGKKRFITPIEAERMQSFPDDWTNTGMPKKRRYFMMGNALVTALINRMSDNLSKIIENE